MNRIVKGIKNNSLIVLIIALIMVSFLAFTFVSVRNVYVTVRSDEMKMMDSFAQNVYEAVNKELQQPITVGRTIVSTETLINLLEHEDDYTQEEMEEIFKHYLLNYIDYFQFSTISIISDKSGRYYTQLGFNKVIDPEHDEHDIWYKLFLDRDCEYGFDIDVDEVVGNQWTLFMNIRISDREGNLLGVSGLGVDMTYLQDIIANLEKEYNITISFEDDNGDFQLGSQSQSVNQRILSKEDLAGSKDIHAREVGNKYVITRHLDDLGWNIVVEKDNDSKELTMNMIESNILIMFILLIIIIMTAYFFISDNQKKLLDENEEAKKSNAAKGLFLANMSHEIRTPINGILGMDEMLLRECTDEKLLEYGRNIQSAGQNLLSIVNDILDFSKIEAGKMEILEVPYDLFTVLNDCYNINIFRIKKKGIKFELNIDPEVPIKLSGDEVRIHQIINNLLSNAAKYTNEGEITLSVTYETENADEIRLIISVKDTGIGIREEDLNKLFDAFTRVEEEKNRKVEGTGLGLNLCHNLVKLMQGDIRVSSTYGKGTEFVVSLPQKVLADEKIGDFSAKYLENAKRKKSQNLQIRAEQARILVVDDVEMNLLVVKSLLEKTGIEIDTAPSGSSCLVKMNSKEYDLVFLDHLMPGMDGVETLQKWNSGEKKYNQATPVIMLTANALTGAKEEYMNAGFTDYLSKPVSENDLLEMLVKYLPADKVVRSDLGTDEQETFCLPALTDNIERQYRERIREKGLVFDVVLDENLPAAYYGNGKLYELAVSDLLEESCKHTNVGKISLHITAEEAPRENMAFIKVSIMDSGDSFDYDSTNVRNAYDLLLSVDSPLRVESIPGLGASMQFVMKQKVSDSITVREYYEKEKDMNQSVENETENSLIGVTEDQTENQVETGDEDLDMEGIDSKEGLAYVRGKRELYIHILKEFVKAGAGFTDSLTKAFEIKDIAAYRIAAHSLKSGSYTIGAKELGDLAKEMEFAAKDENEELIIEKHEILISKLKRQVEVVKTKLEQEGISFSNSNESLREKMLDAIDNFDKETAFEIMQQIEEKDGSSELLGEIKQAIEDFNYIDAHYLAAKL